MKQRNKLWKKWELDNGITNVKNVEKTKILFVRNEMTFLRKTTELLSFRR